MERLQIRPAIPGDVPSLHAIVEDAYGHYIERMGRAPAPMTADYSDLVKSGVVWVLADEDGIAGLIVIKTQVDHVLVSNVAVSSAHQRRGLGRRLLEHAEALAARDGINQLRLYTNELMHENVEIYAKLGWEVYDRAELDGYHRVFMRKSLLHAEA